MDLSEKVYHKLKLLFEKSKKKKTYELEIRFSSNKINYQIYKNIFQKLTFSKLNNGKGLKYDMINDLDIFINSNNTKSRMTISGSDNIKQFWLNQDLAENTYSYIEKEKIDTFDDSNFDLRISLNEEIPKEKIIKKDINILKSDNKPKYFRFKNRYRIHAEDDSFFIDLTNVKSGYGNNFHDSNTINNISKYEIEIEINNNVHKDNIDDLLTYVYLILSEIEGNIILIGNKIKEKVVQDYLELVQINNNQNKYLKNKFIAANPKTIHKENMINTSEIKNIYNRYAVTLKADGERYLLFINNEGEQYLINNQFHVISNGQINKTYKNTIIEGELINTDTNKIFYAYDMLFNKGEDIRKRWLKTLKKDSSIEEKYLGRIDYLDRFLHDKNHQILPQFQNTNNYIENKKKPYEYSLRNDGSDIFDKIKNIWSTRKANPYNVDGIILCPIMEHYPLRGGTWDSLFKWKPSYLNTIDFLVKYVKDEEGSIINSPFIEKVTRADSIKEQSLKMYRTLELYVGAIENTFNKNQKKMVDKVKPVLFNPYHNPDIYLDDNNSAKLFIDGNEKIYCNDPLTNDSEELMDDTIVEFGFDESCENGFKWKPYRFRKDKTNLYKSGENVFGNFDRVANDIFRSIKNPVTDEMITTGKIDISNIDLKENKSYFSHITNNDNKFRERLPYQNFHNFYIKYQLYYFTSPNYLYDYSSGMHGRLLDLCSGKGVDITKIKLMNYAEVVGLEVDGDAVKYAQNFYKTVARPKPKSYYVRSDTSKLIFPYQACGISESDKIYVKKFIPEKYYFDTVSLMFCIHYFFQNEITLRTIIQNMNDTLKIGGHVIGTTFDGEVIYNQLKDKTEIMGHKKGGELMWKIEKKYKSKIAFTDKKPNLGKEIDVLVKSIGVTHKEYLVNFKYFDKIMNEYGFEKVIQKPFEDFYNELMEGKNIMNLSEEELKKNKEKVEAMSEDEKRFSFLSTAFIYKKVENSSDKLYIKLAELMEKEEKIKGKDVYAVDKSTAEIIQKAELYEEK